MRWTERRERFRAILEGKACMHPASVFDPVSARIAEDLGFELGMFAGSIASLAVLGGVGADLNDRDFLGAHGVRISLQGHQPLMAAVAAVRETRQALREGTPPAKLANLASAQLMQQISRDADYARWGESFLGNSKS
jgi:2-methylisocitrate lyase-like PEP mutase family enzyme